MKTYNEIAEEIGLKGITKERYIAYMRLRWGNPEDEDLKCRVGYAQEWANRFKKGYEYQASDSEGKQILAEIDKRRDETTKLAIHDEDRGWVYFCDKCNRKVDKDTSVCPHCLVEFEGVEKV